MAIVAVLIGVLTTLAGYVYWSGAESAIHQGVAAIVCVNGTAWLAIGAIASAGGRVIAAIKEAGKENGKAVAELRSLVESIEQVRRNTEVTRQVSEAQLRAARAKAKRDGTG